jgi:ABC-2 type transport system permease protein
MRVGLVHARLETLELARYPSFLVPTLLFPALFFLFFVVPGAEGAEADALTATYMAFAFLGVAFFQFGVGFAVERVSSWALYVRTLPAGALVRMTGHIVSAAVFSLASGLLVAVVASTLAGAHLAPTEWLALLGALAAGAIPFGLLGMALGYLASPKGALPIANILYLGLAYLGGLWTGPDRLPAAIEGISEAIPTRAYADLVIAAATGTSPPPGTLALVGWTAAFAVLAGWAYRRDEGVRYR